MSDYETAIMLLWENSGHGTRREDVEAAYAAGAAENSADKARMDYLSADANYVLPEEVISYGSDLRAFADWCIAGNDPYDFTPA